MARPRKQESQLEISEEINDSIIENDSGIEENIEESQLEISEDENYNVEVINSNKHLKVGQTFKVSGNVAKNLLSKNLIKII